MTGPLPTIATPKGKLGALDGLRGLAASWVVIHHLSTNRLIGGGALLANGWLLVDVFFVISGFVLAYRYGGGIASRADLGRFVQRRIARIWPLHAAILLLMLLPRLASLVVHGAAGNQLFEPGGHHSLGAFFASLFLIHGMGPYSDAVWNGPSWTLSVEFFAYLLFAGSVMLARGRLTVVACALVVASATVLTVSGVYLAVPMEWAFLRCVYGFFAGVAVLALLRRLPPPDPRRRPGAAATAIELLLGAAIVALIAGGGQRPSAMLLIPACAAMVLALAVARGWVAHILAREPFQSLGAWSLGIYLLHIPILNVLYGIARRYRPLGLDFSKAGWGTAESVVFLVLVLAVAAAAHIWLERPARSLLTYGFAGRRRPAGAGGPAASAIAPHPPSGKEAT